MDRTQILHTLLEREERRRDEAIQAWRESQRQAQAAHEQADALVTYRGEYRKRWAAQFAKAAPIEIVRCYHGFVGRLDQAITAQQGTAEMADARERQAQALVHQRELKLATVRRLIERRQHSALQQAQRREQRGMDEAAQRVARLAAHPLNPLALA